MLSTDLPTRSFSNTFSGEIKGKSVEPDTFPLTLQHMMMIT